MASSEEKQKNKVRILLGLIGTGTRGFERARKDYDKTKYDGKAINASSLEPVNFTGSTDTRCTYFKDRRTRFPPVRFETPLQEYLPLDGKLRVAVEDWFYGSLEAGMKLDTPAIFKLASERSSDTFFTELMQKYCPAHKAVPTERQKKKAKKRLQPLNLDEEKKKAKNRNHLLDSDEDDKEPVEKKKGRRILDSDEEDEPSPTKDTC